MHPVTLDAQDVRAAVPMSEAIAAVREALLDLAAGEFEQPVRTAMRDGQFLIMSTHHRPSATAMVKSLSLDFGRVPAIAGTVTWIETGQPRPLIADAGAVTALRTGAISGVATDLLAAPAADRMAIIGAGAQAADQVRAVHAVRPLRRLAINDRTRERADAMAAVLTDELPDTQITVTESVDDAVQDVDIIGCATSATEPVLTTAALPKRVHVNAIGAFRPTMRELPDDLLAEATIVIDDREAILEESGEILHALAAGAIAQSDLTVLGEALAGSIPQLGDRTIFKTVGIAAQDWAMARALAARYLPTA